MGGAAKGEMGEQHDLDRFLRAQAGTYADAIAELAAGRKRTHWMWWIFPQLAGLGTSSTARTYAIRSLGEARDYLAHPVLGPRLRECAQLVLAAPGTTADEILASDIDARKLRSSMTLFLRADPDEVVFARVLERFWDGETDAATEGLLAAAGEASKARDD